MDKKLVILFILAVSILSYHIDKPFTGHHDWNSVVYSNIARNYVRYGWFRLKFGQVRNYDAVHDLRQLNFLTHYPPLLPLMMSLSFRVFGVAEWSARLIPILTSAGMLVMIYKIGKKLFNDECGFLASLFVAVSPLFIYFGKLPVHDSVTPFFSLIAFWGYLNYDEVPSLFNYSLIIFGVVLGGLVNWTGYYIVVPIILHSFLYKRKLTWEIFGLLPLCICLFVVHLLHVKLLTGYFFGGGFWEVFFFRANPYQSAVTYGFSLPKYVRQELLFLRVFFTNIVTFLSFIFLVRIAWLWYKRRIDQNEIFLLLLLIYGLIHLVIFQNLAFIHDYMIYYLLPFFALSAARTYDVLVNLIPNKILQNIATVVLLGSISFERLPFTLTLLATDMNLKGVEIAQFIKGRTKSGEIAFISSPAYREFYEVFIGYYADRQVDYGSHIDNEQVGFYRLIIRPKAHDTLKAENANFLDTNFMRHEDEKYFWYDTQNHKSYVTR